MAIVSISLTDDLLKRIDQLVNEKGYSTRSEAIRDAVRSYLSEHELKKFESGKVSATITAICEHGGAHADDRLASLRHEHNDIVSGNFHVHLSEDYCLDVFVTEGDSARVMDFISKVRAVRGIEQVKFSLVPMVRKSSYA